jgi:molecular chaperone GrpE
MTDDFTQPELPADDSNGELDVAEAGPAVPDESREADVPASDAAALELEGLRRERDELRERWLRAAAELDNFRKRTRKEIDDVRVYAVAGLLRDLLEILDNFERAVISLRESAGQEGELDSLRNGVGLIHLRFRDILMSQGLERIEAVGTEFDPALHEAILQVEKEGAVPGQIAEVVQPGYRLKDLVIRPCRVIVAK